MKYFKNTELAKIYNVSEKSVRNWIDAAKQGKLELQLHEENGKSYIANLSKNTTIVEKLVDKGKKYKNTRGYKVVSPTAGFYKLFEPKVIFDITSNLDIYHEIPLQYSYFDGGASIWDEYVQKLSKQQTPNILYNTIKLLDINWTYISSLLEGCDRINIVDIGPGNAYPVREFLKKVMDSGKLNRYIALDVSRDMMNIAERNIRQWFGDEVPFEGHVLDITHERFNDLLATDSFSKEETVRNVVLLLGSTLSNFRDPRLPLYSICESMGKDDLLLFSKQLDTPHARRYFDYSIDSDGQARLSPLGRFMFDSLGVDESLYDVELFFDTETMARRLQIRLKVALAIEFQLEGKAKVISFNKGDTILFWRHRHQDALQTVRQFDEGGFKMLQATTSPDGECIFSISKIKADPDSGRPRT